MQHEPSNGATVGAKEVAAALGVSPWAVYQAARKGTLPIPVIRIGKSLRFSRNHLERLLDGDAVAEMDG